MSRDVDKSWLMRTSVIYALNHCRLMIKGSSFVKDCYTISMILVSTLQVEPLGWLVESDQFDCYWIVYWSALLNSYYIYFYIFHIAYVHDNVTVEMLTFMLCHVRGECFIYNWKFYIELVSYQFRIRNSYYYTYI